MDHFPFYFIQRINVVVRRVVPSNLGIFPFFFHPIEIIFLKMSFVSIIDTIGVYMIYWCITNRHVWLDKCIHRILLVSSWASKRISAFWRKLSSWTLNRDNRSWRTSTVKLVEFIRLSTVRKQRETNFTLKLVVMLCSLVVYW